MAMIWFQDEAFSLKRNSRAPPNPTRRGRSENNVERHIDTSPRSPSCRRASSKPSLTAAHQPISPSAALPGPSRKAGLHRNISSGSPDPQACQANYSIKRPGSGGFVVCDGRNFGAAPGSPIVELGLGLEGVTKSEIQKCAIDRAPKCAGSCRQSALRAIFVRH
jgi:hypothetical protein